MLEPCIIKKPDMNDLIITEIIRSFYANFFTVGTLVPTVFHLFLAVLFLSRPSKSKSSFHIGLTFVYMFLFNFGYFIASSFYHPMAAFHRWITVGTILLCEAHTNMFIYYFHEERHPLFGKIFLGLQYVVSIFLTYIFYKSTYHAEKIYIINAHQWDFNADDISRLIGIVIQAYVVIFLLITVWKVLTIKTRERWIILLMSISYVVITLVPSASNVMSRSGLLSRETFQIMWNMFNILGFTFLAILAINFTRDRSSVVVKIIGVSLVTILMLFQGFSYFLYMEQEGAYDRLHSVYTRLTAETDEIFSDSGYLAMRDLSGGDLSVGYQKSPGTLFDGITVSSSLLNTAFWKNLERLDDRDFKKNLYLLLEGTHPSFDGYKRAIIDNLREADDEMFTKKNVLELIVQIQRSIRGERHAISNLPDDGFRQSILKFLGGNSDGKFVCFKNALLAHLEGTESQGKNLKSEIMSFLQPVTPPGTRHYRIAGKNHFVAFHYIDLAKHRAYEVGYTYLSYRENLHPAAVKFVYMLFVIIFIILFGFPLFFRGILVTPLFRLVQGLEKLEKGDYGYRIPVFVKDEIGYVTFSFNRMAETIRDAKDKLDSYTLTLEEMVKARTGELEQAYEKMRESEEMFRDIIENATEGIHIGNSRGEIVYMNPLGLKKLGYTHEEIVGKNYIDMIRPEFREKAALFYLDQMKNNIEDTYLECPVVTKDGRDIWIGMSVKLYRDKEGKLGFYCIARDITDRVKAEEALRESEEKYRQIVESATDGIFRNDVNGNFLYVNPTGQNLLGYPVEELMTMNYLSVVQPDHVDKIRDAYRHQLKNKLQESYLEFPIIRKDGTVRWLGQRVQLEKNLKGEYEFHGISRDVTEKVIAEESLRMSEEKYRTILETIREGYYEVDLKGNITFVNNSVCNLWGFSKDEIVGLNFRNFVKGDDADNIYSEFNKLYMGLEHANIVAYKIVHKNGKELHFEQTFDGITDNDGRIVGFRGVVRDVTERIIALDALRASEEKYRLLIENAGDIIYHCDWRGFFIYFSPSAYKLSGYSPKDIIGKHFSEIIPPNSRQAVIEYYLEQFKQRTTQSYYELPILIKDGSVMWVGQVVSIVTGTDGKIEFYSIARDITEKKKALEALHESEEKYRSILGSIQEGYFEVDLDGTLVFCNEAMCTIWGRSMEEMIGLNYRQFTSEKTAAEMFREFNKVFKTGEKGIIIGWEITRQDGSIRIAETSVNLMTDDSGGPSGFRGMVRDVTERMKAEEALRESEEKYRTVVSSAKIGYFEISVGGTITFFNKNFADFVGYSDDELMGMDYRKLMSDETAKKVLSAYARVFSGEQINNSVDMEIIRKDGGRVYGENHVNPMTDKNGNVVGFRVLGIDITERKMVDEALKVAKESAESANQAKSRFLASMSHELRTPLNAINGIVDLLRFGSYERDEEIISEMRMISESLRKSRIREGRDNSRQILERIDSFTDYLSSDGNCKRYYFSRLKEDFMSMSPARKKKFLEHVDNILKLVDAEERDTFSSYNRIKDAGDYLLGLIDTILNLSKIESGKIEIRKTEVNVRNMVGSVITDVKSYANTKGKETLAIGFDVGDSVPEKIFLDNQKTRQVLLNLLSNAVKFTEEGSVRLTVGLNGGRVMFAVSDTGHGIRDEDKNRIFMEFERTETTKNIEGTGLGLAISKRLIELQGGGVGFESRYGEGSRFWFTLPV